MENIIKEEWKLIPNTIGKYISNIGRYKIETTKSTIIRDSFYKDKDGYYKLTYRDKDGRSRGVCIHRLVALLFIPNNNEEKTCVNHKDSNRLNNIYSNLEWVTPKENVHHSFVSGNRSKCLQVPRTSKLTPYQISQIQFLRQYYSLKKVADLFNVSYQTMKNITIKLKRKQSEILDNQQPSLYTNIYSIKEGSTTIPKGSTL